MDEVESRVRFRVRMHHEWEYKPFIIYIMEKLFK